MKLSRRIVRPDPDVAAGHDTKPVPIIAIHVQAAGPVAVVDADFPRVAAATIELQLRAVGSRGRRNTNTGMADTAEDRWHVSGRTVDVQRSTRVPGADPDVAAARYPESVSAAAIHVQAAGPVAVVDADFPRVAAATIELQLRVVSGGGCGDDESSMPGTPEDCRDIGVVAEDLKRDRGRRGPD